MVEPIYYIMRHGKTEWNLHKRIQGRNNSPLLSESLILSRKMANYLLQCAKLNKIFVSPLGRAVETAEIICGVLGIGYIKNDLLMECNHGICEGMRLDEVKEVMPSFVSSRESDKWNTPWPQGESYADVFLRAEIFVRQLTMNDSVLIVGHEMFNKCLAGCLLNWRIEKILSFRQKNNELIKISGLGLQMISFSDKGWHIEEA